VTEVCETVAIAPLDLLPTGYERTLPPGVLSTVRARRQALADRARGRVLDLGGADRHATLWGAREVVRLDCGADPRLDRLTGRDERFDTVFSVFQLSAAHDLASTLAQLRQVLAPEGVVLFLEPGRLVGLAGRSQRVLGRAVAATAGWHLDRDIPMELRRAGLSVTDLERHRAPTTQWWLRIVVEGTAHHSLVPPRH
jgi:SAM-dependent methyltransferase